MNSIPKGINAQSAVAMIVTPAMAAKYLEANTKNRPLAQGKIDEFAEAMTDVRWQLNGETIKFASDGSLLDGQHRLHACVKSGCSFPAYVVTGINPDSFDTIDIGKKRTAGDILYIAGTRTYPKDLAAAARWCIAYYKGSLLHRNSITTDKIRKIVAEDPLLDRANELTPGATEKQLVSRSLRIALTRLFAAPPGLILDQEQIETRLALAVTFFAQIESGDAQHDDAAWIVRERLIKDRLAGIGRGLHQRSMETVALLCVRAWNARLLGKTPTKFLLPKGGNVVDLKNWPTIL